MSLTLLAVFLSSFATEPRSKEVWAARLVENAEQLLSDEATDDSERTFVQLMAGGLLAGAGHANDALGLLNRFPNKEDRLIVIHSIADGQSTADDVAGALRTAELMPEGTMKQRTLGLVAIRQAQRGDWNDAVELLAKIDSPQERRRALKLIIKECYKRGENALATELTARVDNQEVLAQLNEYRQHLRDTPKPQDPDFVERTVSKAREDWGELIGFSDNDARYLRAVCQARVAMHHQDEAAFRRAMKAGRRRLKDFASVKRRSRVMVLGALYHRMQDDLSARQMFSEGLDYYLRNGDGASGAVVLDLDRVFLSTGSAFDAVVAVMPGQEIEDWVSKLEAHGAIDLCSAMIASTVMNSEKRKLGHELYRNLTTPSSKFRSAALVLDKLNKQ